MRCGAMTWWLLTADDLWWWRMTLSLQSPKHKHLTLTFHFNLGEPVVCNGSTMRSLESAEWHFYSAKKLKRRQFQPLMDRRHVGGRSKTMGEGVGFVKRVYGHCILNLRWKNRPLTSNNWSILLMQSFTAYKSLLTLTSTFRSLRR